MAHLGALMLGRLTNFKGHVFFQPPAFCIALGGFAAINAYTNVNRRAGSEDGDLYNLMPLPDRYVVRKYIKLKEQHRTDNALWVVVMVECFNGKMNELIRL